MAGEDVQDELGAVKDATGESGLEVAQLGGSEVVVKEDEVSLGGGGDAGDLLDLALADERGRVGTLAALHDFGNDRGAG